jgi:hypothetical protein
VPRVGDIICPFRQRYDAPVRQVRWFADRQTTGMEAEVVIWTSHFPDENPLDSTETLEESGFTPMVGPL